MPSPVSCPPAEPPTAVAVARLGGRALPGTPVARRPEKGRATLAATDPHAPLRRGCKPRGCRAPARRVLGRRVRYVIGCEPGQVNGRRWRRREATRSIA
ncbi:tryptophan biosynthesis modulator TrpM [Streptomyces sp. NPDC054933]